MMCKCSKICFSPASNSPPPIPGDPLHLRLHLVHRRAPAPPPQPRLVLATCATASSPPVDPLHPWPVTRGCLERRPRQHFRCGTLAHALAQVPDELEPHRRLRLYPRHVEPRSAAARPLRPELRFLRRASAPRCHRPGQRAGHKRKAPPWPQRIFRGPAPYRRYGCVVLYVAHGVCMRFETRPKIVTDADIKAQRVR